MRLYQKWEWVLKSAPESLWPFLSDTNQFNADAGLPSVRVQGQGPDSKRMATRIGNIAIEWEESPFEWVTPQRFGIERRYFKGPLTQALVQAELSPRKDGGSHLCYRTSIEPRNFLGYILIPLQMALLRKQFDRVIRRYDEQIQRGEIRAARTPKISAAMRARIDHFRPQLATKINDVHLANRFLDYLERADSQSLTRIRPYALADLWKVSRKKVLEMFLHATRLSLVEFQWEILCPSCRGAEIKAAGVGEIKSDAHCSSCNIDYNVNFDQLVELTFRPNASIRTIAEGKLFCAGSPQMTPHIYIQLNLSPGEELKFTLGKMEEGRYRMRASGVPGGQMVEVSTVGLPQYQVRLGENDWPEDMPIVSPRTEMSITNALNKQQRFILERMEWSDQAATAREVLLLPLFRDLFSKEILRQGEKISVGSIVILFTDLKNSTKLYREVGDATAFGFVMSHFDVLTDSIVKSGGIVIKTIGDAVMAVFTSPGAALEAALQAQEKLSASSVQPLLLKAGIHYGPCIAITQNERMDYFGTSVNIAARLSGFSAGDDIIVSKNVFTDPDIEPLKATGGLEIQAFSASLKGFENEPIELFRMKRPKAPVHEPHFGG